MISAFTFDIGIIHYDICLPCMQPIIPKNSAFSAEQKIFICYVILHGGMSLILQLQLYQSVVKKTQCKITWQTEFFNSTEITLSQRSWPAHKERLSQNENI